jgi:FkbM family methyltransferase
MISNGMMPVAKKIHGKLFNGAAKVDFSRQQYAELPALKCTISYNKYGGYCVPESSRHRPAAQAILSNDVWEPETIKFIMSNCANGDVIHAGTYFGDFLPALSKAAARGSKIWAFEPNQENYRCARITLDINSAGNVVLTNAGLGEKAEHLFLKTHNESGKSLGGASKIIAIDTTKETVGVEAVEIVTIDNTVGIDRSVSIIQLDVEGHECEALKGGLKTIQRCLPVIF